ncbi:MAG: Xenobiotic-transporting ATPase [Candidatus Peregrinibacteria bacterium Gr01-1014_25]|nr:MAG: Xenobiotic-transporting ATPase [Candidatus Peregrinibacteria bacterium Gr01-1014_25]
MTNGSDKLSAMTPQTQAVSHWKVLRQVYRLLREIHISPTYFIPPILLSIGGAAMEGIGAGLLIPLLNGFLTKDYSFITSLPGLSPLIQTIFGESPLRDRTLFAVLILIFITVIILKNLLKFTATLGMSFLATRAVHHLRKQIFNTYLSFDKLYFDRSNVGHHSTVLTVFSNYAFTPVLIIDKVLQALFSLTAYFVVMCLISWKLTLLAVPIFLLLHFSVRRLIKRIQRLSMTMAQQLSVLGKTVVEILSVIPLVKTMNMEEAERKHYCDISDATARIEFRKITLQKAINPVQELITLLAIFLLFSGMLYLLVRDGQTTGPSFLVYFYLVMNAANKFAAITGFQGDTASVAGQVAGVCDVFENMHKHRMADGKTVFGGLQRHIEFRDMHFSYTDGSPILRGVSFAIDKGKVTAVVGPTGVGKTTIISLLLRFYDVPPGSLLVDGDDIRSFTAASLRSHMALVSQETLLLHESLRQNIAYGQENVDEEQLRAVLRNARLDELVERLPQGWDTLIGDRGVKLSGGEKQRVSIARALLKGADILILDEATSSLDSTTEKIVQEAVEEAIRGKTAIVIAHRLSTIKNADHIVVIDGGRCVEQGTLEQLLEHNGKFAELWRAQSFS